MPTNSEIYERGVIDAEQDDLNPFYYQHYYYYRRGYDQTRRRMRRPPTDADTARPLPWLIPAGLALVVALIGVVWWLAGSLISPAAAIPTSAPLLPSTPVPATPIPEPSPTAAPSPSPVPVLQVGGRARIMNVGAGTLRARVKPGLNQSIQVRFPEGSEVMLLEGPTEADGLRWWRIAGPGGEGWCAEQSPEGLLFLQPLP